MITLDKKIYIGTKLLLFAGVNLRSQERSVLEKVAWQIVRNCLRVRENDMVTINTWHHTIDLAEELAFECYKVGAVPLITLMTDNLWYRMINELPAESLTKPPLHVLKSLDEETVCINIHGPENPPSPDTLKTESIKAIREAYKPISDKERKLRIRVADVYLGKVTPHRAKIYGINYEKWKSMMLEALAVDYDKIRNLGIRIAKILENADEVHITSDMGTDLRIRVSGRKARVEDGVIDEYDVKAGDTFTLLPAGMVEIAPIENTANGVVVFDVPQLSLGKCIKGLKWVFKNGRLVDVKADENLEIFMRFYEGMTGDKDRIGRFIIGLNPAIKPYGILTELSLGTTSIGIGYNEDLGGENKGTAYYNATITKPTVKVDGEVIMIDGKLIV